LFASIGVDRDYSELDLAGLTLDLQGWGSTRPVFERVLAEVRPAVVVEVGTWKGASLLHMHALARDLGLDCEFICVDTWLGSSDIWMSPKDRARLRVKGGYPDLYRQFVFNLVASDALDVFPLPMTSVAAADVLARLGISADVVYIDGGHTEPEVSADIVGYFPLLRKGGLAFGDDYDAEHPGVVRAVDSFCGSRRIELELDGRVWLARKQAG